MIRTILRRLAIALLLSPAPIMILVTLVFARGVYPDGPRSDWFKSLKQPTSGNSCCDVSDCHQTQAVQALDGHWRAILQDYNATRWVDVPQEKVVKNPHSIDGEAYLCYTQGGEGGSMYYGGGETVKVYPFGATIYCFIPPRPLY